MIAAEGKIILVPIILLALATTGISVYSEISGSGLKGVNITLWVFILFCLYFFRDPVRIPLGEANQMVSPADGKVVQIIDIIRIHEQIFHENNHLVQHIIHNIG